MSEPDADGSSRDGVEYDPAASQYTVFECPDCDNVVLTIGQDEPPLSCHDQPMEHVSDADISVQQPEVREILLQAFGLPKAGLDICLCVIGEGPLSAGEVAETLGYDRSTVTRYLNELVDMGLLQRSELNREDGGVVNAYHSVDLDRMRRETLIGFYIWAGEAASLIEDANLKKREYMEENPDSDLPDVFWDSLSDD